MDAATKIMELSAQLATAQRALERRRKEGPKPGDLIRQNPRCSHRCEVCPLECAIISGVVEDTRRDLAKAVDDAGPILAYDGRFFVAVEGRA